MINRKRWHVSLSLINQLLIFLFFLLTDCFFALVFTIYKFYILILFSVTENRCLPFNTIFKNNVIFMLK